MGKEKSAMLAGAFLKDIKDVILNARRVAFNAVNLELLRAYFEIGKRIVEEEQSGNARAGYGQNLLELLSGELCREFGLGFDASNLRRMRRFYLTYSKWEAVSPKLSWSHYCELIKIGAPEKRAYFQKYAQQENLSIRDLKRQICSFHYERLLMSRDKKALVRYKKKSFVPEETEELVKDPYILEFLDLGKKQVYTERELESKILDDLQKFLLELGQGFSFIARQKMFTVNGEHFHTDLLFYNVHLKCYVAIELKTAKFRHEDAGQMNFYLNCIRNGLNMEGDNGPVGIILCTEKDRVQV